MFIEGRMDLYFSIGIIEFIQSIIYLSVDLVTFSTIPSMPLLESNSALRKTLRESTLHTVTADSQERAPSSGSVDLNTVLALPY